MLGMLINTSLPWAPNTWKIWVDHIMKQKPTYGFKKAALIHDNGATASATSGFILHPQEVLRVKQIFALPVEKRPESIIVQGKTYIIKSISDVQIVAFNGAKYIIICKSKSKFIVVLCESKSKSSDGAVWLKKINSRLIQKDF
jgi:hypothetical protein